MAKLALCGGKPVRADPFPRYVTIGEEEKRAVMEVLDTGVLSGYLGTWSPQFYGGPRVRKLEREWEEYFGVRHAVSVNSATSGLYAAVGAAGVSPGDEVIVSPYTMTASATGALMYNAVPVFADIDPETFCITPETIRQVLSPRTKAIITVDLFGHPADFDGIMALAAEHNLVVIEDAAQAPGAQYHGRFAGTLAHIGVFSLNCHKTIQCGEGGVVVTNDDRFAERLQLIRNHGEVVVGNKGVDDISNLIGFNYRMTEVEAAIASEQLKKLERLLLPRIEAADFLRDRLKHLRGITPPVVRDCVRHGYYEFAIRYDAQALGVHRDRFVEALNAEGIPMYKGYMKPIYLEPMYQSRTGYGANGCPFTPPYYEGNVNYEKGICPVTERMYLEELMFTDLVHASLAAKDLEDVVTGIDKVLEHTHELQD
ncbi:MAG: DegT/DnrJ/EryC1/StrS aminotransferase [Armatimonadetes bacterium CG2_30_59_28]|nr:DegT/DnrJ/EryC1/StrS family aminotransferase [Armatimonadota bacterium]OIO90061.1 MAG: DegT/DnrJ/EryC1/StrS aminotransferase [Armatimonadetes bacterium CG2_30_59_28]PIU60524.1 MAG: DegT/DnrJ/EryC1/StrS family aminotransferase [Armatimonadetes bacterium CG07_land_8_20_14_0_80_59_28]PIX43241.1 MAG: DegT/DnrJ/EryC1/StrS family aminotransferase [Armatimonadetes bacterium CG_4_8_14_3_um_filter_58_9]PIY37330.1 MAG: DegT/DnrJ/EryC1/StrS family aminotransferase [Armatimonadetes bacterium CG_4_10_14_